MKNRRASAEIRRSWRRRPVIHVLPDEVALRVVCHESLVGGVIGPNGVVVSQIRRETGAKIHCQKPENGSKFWVIFVVGSNAINNRVVLTDGVRRGVDCKEAEWVDCEVSIAQAALIRVSERVWAVLAENNGSGQEKEAYCGILADKTQIGAVLGIRGKNVEWMRRETGAKIRVLQSPDCGTSNDDLIQVTGRVLAVKKALVMVSGCLQDCLPLEGYPPPLSCKPFETSVDVNSEDPHSEFFPHLSSLLPPVTAHSSVDAASSGHLSSTEAEWTSRAEAKDTEHKVVFKMICTYVAAGGIIGPKGSIIRALQNETGASITLGAPLPISGDRIVTISAHENLDSWYSPAQDALIHVFEKSVNIDTGKGLMRGSSGAIVKARLLVPSDSAHCLSENRDIIEVTGAELHVLGGDQILDCISENEVVIEIVGQCKDVRNTLSQVTSKLRDNLLPKDVLSELGVRNPYGSAKARPQHSSIIFSDPTQDSIHAQEMESHTLDLQPAQNASRGHSRSISGSEQDSKELQRSPDWLLPAEFVNEVGRRSTNGGLKNTAPSARQENNMAKGMKELELSSNGVVGRSGGRQEWRCKIQREARVEVQDPEGGEGMIVISGSPRRRRASMGYDFVHCSR